MILRALKGLEDKISVSVVNPYMGDKGWTFEPDAGVVSDPVGNAQYLYEVYLKAQPDYSGRVTVPVLWDLERNTIVNNESAEIIRMLNSAFDDIGATPVDFSPAALLPQIDQVNSRIYNSINNGVYKAGFATDQAVYEKEVSSLFAALDELETELGQRRYLLGQTVTEADWRLFTTLIRFDAVYHGHFKCNLRRLVDYENLWSYTRELYQWPGVAATIDFDHIKRHYYQSHQTINPNGIVPLGPILDLERPPSRKL
jgi:putative glutathione S-transferase